MTKRVLCLVAICFLVCISSSAYSERPIRILLLDAQSGPAKNLGDRYFLGLKFAADEVNKQGGLLGRTVEVIMEDSQVKPDIALRKAQKYLLKGEVDVLTTGSGSHVAKAIKGAAKESGVLFMNLTMSDQATESEFSPHSVRLVYASCMMARCLVDYLAKQKGFKKFYLLNQDYSYGRDMAASFKREIERLIPDGTIVGEDYHPLFNKDFSPFLSKIKATDAEAILTANWGPDISILLKQRAELGVPAVVVNNAMADPMSLREVGAKAIGSIVCDVWVPTMTSDISLDFKKRWEAKYRGSEYPEPDTVSARTYIAAKYLFEAIRKAGSVKAAKVVSAMEGMHQESLNGEIYLRACDHQLQSPLPVVEVVSGTYPYFGVPYMMPAKNIEIPKESVNNPRCK